MRVLGIDPGARTGAFAVLTETGSIVGDLPTVEDGVNAAELYRMIRNFKPDVCVLERVSSMPGQGVRSVFVFGQAYGCIKAVLSCAGVSTELVTPAKWKGHFKLPGKDKNAARSLAIQLYPNATGLSRVKDHGRAEALLLARYYVETRK
jgi:crossover junction endodeoxyribonuclease RuvC